MWFGWRLGKRRGLRTWVLSIIASSPKNGAEIMEQIEIMTQGWWRPSPGSVYPLLEELASEGLLRKRDDGRYELVEKAREEIGWPFGISSRRPQSIEQMLDEISGYISYFEDVSRSNKSKMAPYDAKVKSIRDRLSALL